MGATTIAQDQQHTIGTIIKNSVELLTEWVVGMHSTVCPLLRFYLSPFIVCFGNAQVHSLLRFRVGCIFAPCMHFHVQMTIKRV